MIWVMAVLHKIGERSATAASCFNSSSNEILHNLMGGHVQPATLPMHKARPGARMSEQGTSCYNTAQRHGGNKTGAVHLWGKRPARKGDARQASRRQDQSCCCWEASLRRAMRASAAAAMCSLFLLASCSDLDSAAGLLAFPCLLLQH